MLTLVGPATGRGVAKNLKNKGPVPEKDIRNRWGGALLKFSPLTMPQEGERRANRETDNDWFP